MDFYPSIEIKFKLNSKLKLRDSLWILNYFLKEAEGAQDGDIDSLCDSKRMCKKKKTFVFAYFLSEKSSFSLGIDSGDHTIEIFIQPRNLTPNRDKRNYCFTPSVFRLGAKGLKVPFPKVCSGNY